MSTQSFRTDADVARLVGLVGDVDRFASEYWGRRPLHRRPATRREPILTIDEIEDLLVAGARRPTFRLVQDGVPLPPERSTRATRLGGTVVEDAADLERIAEALAQGATLVMQSLHRTTKEVAELCRSLERATSHTVQANAYLTPAGDCGLAAHRDQHDVIVLQLSGTKAWQVDGLGPIVLGEGDVLYLPAQTEHAAGAQGTASLHLTIGLLTTSYADVVRRLISRSGGLHRPLPLGYARPERADHVASELRAALDDTATRLRSFDVTESVEFERDRSCGRRRSQLRGHLRGVLELDAIDLDTVVRRREDQPSRRAALPDGRVEIRLPGRVVTLPGISAAAVSQLLTGDPVEVRELTGIDAESRVVVARRLVREGLLEVLCKKDRTGDR